MRVLLLSNARSGTSRRHRADRSVRKSLEAEGAVVELVRPGSPEEMRERAAGARRVHYDVVLVSGGDGTLSVVVNGLVRTPKDERPPLAILPSGRGNDFAAEMGIGSRDDCVKSLLHPRRRQVDLGRSEAGIFLGVAGTGFDSRAARRAQQTPLLSGSLLYTYAVLRTLLEFRPLQACIRFDGGRFDGLVSFVAAGNTTRYGGGMRITPKAELSDGLLDLCLVRDVSRGTLLRVFPTVFSGSHLSHPRVDYHKTSFVEVETEEPAEVFADGEYLQDTPVRMDVLPEELEVWTT